MRINEADGNIMSQATATLQLIRDDIHEVKTDIAVIKENVKDLPDHESRIRSLEKWLWRHTVPISMLNNILAVYSTIRVTTGK